MENKSADPRPFPIRPVRELSPEVARKIAAGEVIDRPAAVVRELIDNSIDSGATKITVELNGGGIERIRITDNGCGMTAEDLAICTRTHTTSKICDEDDLLTLSTLGFRGEALSSIQAVSRLEITTTRDGREAWRLESGKIFLSRLAQGTIVQIDGLFENFPARRQFLKRPQAETALCRQIFTEKALAWPNIEFRITVDGSQKMILPPAETLKDRCLAALEPKEPESFFYEISGSGEGFSFSAVLGSPDVVRNDRRQLMVFVNGRRIMEYSLLQAIEYGCEGHFPNGGHPFGSLFLTVNSSLVDFNIHPAKREARFRDPASIHHAVSSVIRDFYRRYTLAGIGRESAAIAKGDGFSSTGKETDSMLNNFRTSPEYPELAGLFHGTAERAATDSCLATDRAVYGTGNFRRNDLREKNPADIQDKRCQTEHSDRNAFPGMVSEPKEYYRSQENSSSKKVDPQDFNFLGQVLGTFIAVEKNGHLFLIDQHAAHERILYNEFFSRSGEMQELLVPYRIETSSVEEDRQLEKNRESLAQAGFTVENDGDGMWQVSAVPVRWNGTQKDLQKELLDSTIEPEALVSHLYATAACRAACKDGDVLDPQTARNIASQAFALPEPVCPHGRPVWIVIDRDELFRRIRRT